MGKGLTHFHPPLLPLSPTSSLIESGMWGLIDQMTNFLTLLLIDFFEFLKGKSWHEKQSLWVIWTNHWFDPSHGPFMHN